MVNRLALFDCDGTLVDSQHSIFVCVEEAFARAGLASPGRLAARRVVGLSLLPAMTMLAPHGEAELHEQLAEDYKAAFQRLRRAGLVEEPLFRDRGSVGHASGRWLDPWCRYRKV